MGDCGRIDRDFIKPQIDIANACSRGRARSFSLLQLEDGRGHVVVLANSLGEVVNG